MTKTEFMRKLFKSQIMPDATIRTYQNGPVTRIYMRQEDAPNCGLSNHSTEAGLRKALVTYLRWFAEYVETFAEMVDADHGEALEMNLRIDAVQAEKNAVNVNVDADHAEALEMNLRIDCTAHLNCRTMNAVNQEYVAMRNEADAMNASFDTSFNRAAKNWGAMCWFSRERALLDAHAEALKENERFDNLQFRFVQFACWSPNIRSNTIAAAHAEALEMDKAYDEANAEPEHIGRGLFHASMYCDPKTLPYCRCTIGCPVFEPLIVDLRQLYGESLRDYWQFATEEDRAELVEEQHALALGMDMQRDFYRFPLVLRIVAVGMAHVEALRMNRQIDFFRMPLYQRVSEIEWAHFEALVMDEHRDAIARMVDRSFMLMPKWLRYGVWGK